MRLAESGSGTIQQLLGSHPVRLWVGGLPPGCTADWLSKRLGISINNVDVPDAREWQENRGFAFFTVPKNEMSRCIRLLDNVKFKGHTMKVKPARPDYTHRFQHEWKTLETSSNAAAALSGDAQKDQKAEPCWILNKITVNEHVRFDGVALPGNPASLLVEPYEETGDRSSRMSGTDASRSASETDEEDDHCTLSSRDGTGVMFSWCSDDAAGPVALTYRRESSSLLSATLFPKSLDRKDPQEPVLLDEKLADSDPREDQRLSRAVIPSKHIIFDDGSCNGSTREDQSLINIAECDGDDSRRHCIFDDDESDVELNSDAKLSLERVEFRGERGRANLRLERSFGGDARFRLDERFAYREDDSSYVEIGQCQREPATSEFDREVATDRAKSLSVLSKLLCDEPEESVHTAGADGVIIRTSSSHAGQWTGVRRFDPRHSGHDLIVPISEQHQAEQEHIGRSQHKDDDSSSRAGAGEDDILEPLEVKAVDEPSIQVTSKWESMWTYQALRSKEVFRFGSDPPEAALERVAEVPSIAPPSNTISNAICTTESVEDSQDAEMTIWEQLADIPLQPDNGDDSGSLPFFSEWVSELSACEFKRGKNTTMEDLQREWDEKRPPLRRALKNRVREAAKSREHRNKKTKR